SSSLLAVGSTVELVDPVTDVVKRLVTGQVDMNRGDRDETVAHGVKIGARTIILLATGRADPEELPAARILDRNHVLGAVAMTEPGRLEAANLRPGNVGNVHVQYGVGRQGLLAQLRHQHAGGLGRRFVVMCTL